MDGLQALIFFQYIQAFRYQNADVFFGDQAFIGLWDILSHFPEKGIRKPLYHESSKPHGAGNPNIKSFGAYDYFHGSPLLIYIDADSGSVGGIHVDKIAFNFFVQTFGDSIHKLGQIHALKLFFRDGKLAGDL